VEAPKHDHVNPLIAYQRVLENVLFSYAVPYADWKEGGVDVPTYWKDWSRRSGLNGRPAV